VTKSEPGSRAASQELIEELMGSIVTLDFVLRTLMELPAEALHGEGEGEQIREFLIASACREVEAVGEEGCRAATALIQRVVDRIADDVPACRARTGRVVRDGSHGRNLRPLLKARGPLRVASAKLALVEVGAA
jgi:hypothetical protein